MNSFSKNLFNNNTTKKKTQKQNHTSSHPQKVTIISYLSLHIFIIKLNIKNKKQTTN